MRKLISWFLLAVMTVMLLYLCTSCGLPGIVIRSPSYSYKYLRLWDKTIGFGQSGELYHVGDTVELFPTRKKIVIVKVQHTHYLLADSVN